MFSIGIALIFWCVLWYFFSSSMRLALQVHRWYDYVGASAGLGGVILCVASVCIKLWEVMP